MRIKGDMLKAPGIIPGTTKNLLWVPSTERVSNYGGNSGIIESSTLLLDTQVSNSFLRTRWNDSVNILCSSFLKSSPEDIFSLLSERERKGEGGREGGGEGRRQTERESGERGDVRERSIDLVSCKHT